LTKSQQYSTNEQNLTSQEQAGCPFSLVRRWMVSSETQKPQLQSIDVYHESVMASSFIFDLDSDSQTAVGIVVDDLSYSMLITRFILR
jgi:hypothetical protein